MCCYSFKQTGMSNLEDVAGMWIDVLAMGWWWWVWKWKWWSGGGLRT